MGEYQFWEAELRRLYGYLDKPEPEIKEWARLEISRVHKIIGKVYKEPNSNKEPIKKVS